MRGRLLCLWSCYREVCSVADASGGNGTSGEGDRSASAHLAELALISEIETTEDFMEVVQRHCRGDSSANALLSGGLFLFRKHIRPCWADLCVGGHFRIEQTSGTAAGSGACDAEAPAAPSSSIHPSGVEALPLVADVLDEVSFSRSVAIAGVGVRYVPSSTAVGSATGLSRSSGKGALQITLWTLYWDAATVELLRKDILSKQPTGFTIRFIHHDKVPKDVLERVPPRALTLAPLLEHLAGRGISLAELPAVSVTAGEDVLSSFESESFNVQDSSTSPRSQQQAVLHMHRVAVPMTASVPGSMLFAGLGADGQRHSSSASTGLEGACAPTPVADWTTSWSPTMFLAAQQQQKQESAAGEKSTVFGNPLQAAATAAAVVGSSTSSEVTTVTTVTGSVSSSTSLPQQSHTGQAPQVFLTTLTSSDGSVTTFQLLPATGQQSPLPTTCSSTPIESNGAGALMPNTSTTQVFATNNTTPSNSMPSSPPMTLPPGSSAPPMLFATTATAGGSGGSMLHPMAMPLQPTITFVNQQQQQQTMQQQNMQQQQHAPQGSYYVASAQVGSQDQQQVLHMVEPQRYYHQPYTFVSQHPQPHGVPPGSTLFQSSQPTSQPFGQGQHTLFQQAPQQYQPPPQQQQHVTSSAMFHTHSGPGASAGPQSIAFVGQGGAPLHQTFSVPYGQQSTPTPPVPLTTASPDPFQTFAFASSGMQPTSHQQPHLTMGPTTAMHHDAGSLPFAAQMNWVGGTQHTLPSFQGGQPPNQQQPFGIRLGAPAMQRTSALSMTVGGQAHSHHMNSFPVTNHQQPSLQRSMLPNSSTNHPHWLPQSDRKAFVFRGFVFPPGLNRKEYRHIVHHTDEGVDVGALHASAFPAPIGTPDGEIDLQQFHAFEVAAKRQP